MKNAVVLGFLLFFSLLISVAHAQEDKSLNALTQRVKLLEKHKYILDERLKNKMDELDGSFKLGAKELDIQMNGIKNKLNKDYGNLEKYTWAFGTVTVFTIIALLIGIISFVRKINKIATRKVEEKFEKLFHDDREKLIQLIKSQDEEIKLKQQKSILVLSQTNEIDAFLKDFFTRMGFEKVKFKTFDKSEGAGKTALVVFDDEDNTIEEKQIVDYASRSPIGTICFYFGPKVIRRKELHNRLAFANSRVQLYGNIINALKYQSLL